MRLLCFVLLCAFGLIIPQCFAGTKGADGPKRTNEIIVTLHAEATDDDLVEILSRHPGFIKKKEIRLSDKVVYLLELDQSNRPLQLVDGEAERQNGLADNDPEVESMRNEEKLTSVKVNKKTKYRLRQDLPTETGIWYLDIPSKEKISMRIQQAWALGYTGKNITIGVVDGAIETNNTDLPILSGYDYYDDDDNPNPVDENEATDIHGTFVAGLIKAIPDDVCTTGIAYDANLIAIRLLPNDDSEISDFQMIQALTHRESEVDIFTNSWGPPQTSEYYEAPTEAIKTTGRGGLGHIYVWANGNDGPNGNSNNWDFQNSIYTISVGSIDGTVIADYTTYGTNVLTSAYGGGILKRQLKSTIPFDSCSTESERISGTSFSAPMVTAVVAMALEAAESKNIQLSWRDVQHLIVYSSIKYKYKFPLLDILTNVPSSRQGTIYTESIVNAAGLRFSPYVGFGLLDAEKMVKLASSWTPVGEMTSCEFRSEEQLLFRGNKKPTKTFVKIDPLCEVKFLENVEVSVNFSYPASRGLLKMGITAPSKTKATFQNVRVNDAYSTSSGEDFFTWTYKIVSFWGEKHSKKGKWMLMLESPSDNMEATLHSWSVTVHGTKEKVKPPKVKA